MNIAEFEAMCQVSACDSMILYILGEVYLPILIVRARPCFH